MIMVRWLLCGLLTWGLVACASTQTTVPPGKANREATAAAAPAHLPTDGKEPDSAAVIAAEIQQHLHKLANQRIAVAGFTSIDGESTSAGRLLAEQVETRLSQIDGLKVVERQQLNVIEAEQKFSLSGHTQEELEVGRILNVDAMLFGTIATLDGSEEINARMLDVTTGEILCAVSHRRPAGLREKEMAQLPPDLQAQIRTEERHRRQQIKRDPNMHRWKQEQKRQLLRLKQTDPRDFDRVVRTLARTERVRSDHPQLFLVLTEPKHSRQLRKLKRAKPHRYGDVKRWRKELGYAMRKVPAYRQVLQQQRRQLIQQTRGN